jgi:hypothetical protein
MNKVKAVIKSERWALREATDATRIIAKQLECLGEGKRLKVVMLGVQLMLLLSLGSIGSNRRFAGSTLLRSEKAFILVLEFTRESAAAVQTHETHRERGEYRMLVVVVVVFVWNMKFLEIWKELVAYTREWLSLGIS